MRGWPNRGGPFGGMPPLAPPFMRDPRGREVSRTTATGCLISFIFFAVQLSTRELVDMELDRNVRLGIISHEVF